MTKKPFSQALMRKSERALKVARLALDAGDNDSAVSRSYYAMFDIARAALLRSGVTEEMLPRTHNGVIEAFRNHAVQSGVIDPHLATQLSRTESLRIKADYTGTEIELVEAMEVVQKAELFVQTVERAFGLDTASAAAAYPNAPRKDGDEVSEPGGATLEPISLEEIRRQARENWFQLRQKNARAATGPGHSKIVDRDSTGDRSQSIDDEVAE